MLVLSAVSITPSAPIPGGSDARIIRNNCAEIVRHSPLICRICGIRGFNFEIYREVRCRRLCAVSLISEAPFWEE